MREIKDFKPFIPSNDYAVSKSFYECMGFNVNWDSGEVCGKKGVQVLPFAFLREDKIRLTLE